MKRKEFKKLRLGILREQYLEEKQMNTLKGGARVCSYSCYWENNTSSSELANRNANYNLGDSGGYSTDGCNQHYVATDYYGTVYTWDCDSCTDSPSTPAYYIV
ncbi:MAG: TIGR04149 family rSAM-modified RiPP [Prevotellaceae bacterium]|jgi:natural product precursor|nr:TIGR04149 family rSAM-modified RiPP [Prevotellaceae bacterium]